MVTLLRRVVLVLVVAGLVNGSTTWAGTTVGGVVQNAVTSSGNGTAVTLYGTFVVATYLVSGTFSATVTFEGSGQDGTFQSLGCVPVTGGAVVSSTTTTGAWRCNVTGLIQIRARVSGYASGSVTVSAHASDVGSVQVGPPPDSAAAVLRSLGLNRDAPTTAGRIAATNAANGGTMLTLTRFTDTAPTGNFLDAQNAAGGSLFTLNAAGAITRYGGASPVDGRLLIGGTTAGTFSAATLTAGTGITITNADNAVTIATTGATVISATTGVLGGVFLPAGGCLATTLAVAGATPAMVATATPVTYPGDGTLWNATIGSADNVTVRVCAVVAQAPKASEYNVRVLP